MHPSREKDVEQGPLQMIYFPTEGVNLGGYMISNRPLYDNETVLIVLQDLCENSMPPVGVTSADPKELRCQDLPHDPTSLIAQPWMIFDKKETQDYWNFKTLDPERINMPLGRHIRNGDVLKVRHERTGSSRTLKMRINSGDPRSCGSLEILCDYPLFLVIRAYNGESEVGIIDEISYVIWVSGGDHSKPLQGEPPIIKRFMPKSSIQSSFTAPLNGVRPELLTVEIPPVRNDGEFGRTEGGKVPSSKSSTGSRTSNDSSPSPVNSPGTRGFEDTGFTRRNSEQLLSMKEILSGQSKGQRKDMGSILTDSMVKCRKSHETSLNTCPVPSTSKAFTQCASTSRDSSSSKSHWLGDKDSWDKFEETQRLAMLKSSPELRNDVMDEETEENQRKERLRRKLDALKSGENMEEIYMETDSRKIMPRYGKLPTHTIVKGRKEKVIRFQNFKIKSSIQEQRTMLMTEEERKEYMGLASSAEEREKERREQICREIRAIQSMRVDAGDDSKKREEKSSEPRVNEINTSTHSEQDSRPQTVQEESPNRTNLNRPNNYRTGLAGDVVRTAQDRAREESPPKPTATPGAKAVGSARKKIFPFEAFEGMMFNDSESEVNNEVPEVGLELKGAKKRTEPMPSFCRTVLRLADSPPLMRRAAANDEKEELTNRSCRPKTKADQSVMMPPFALVPKVDTESQTEVLGLNAIVKNEGTDSDGGICGGECGRMCSCCHLRPIEICTHPCGCVFFCEVCYKTYSEGKKEKGKDGNPRFKPECPMCREKIVAASKLHYQGSH